MIWLEIRKNFVEKTVKVDFDIYIYIYIHKWT
jgi:hypothetical protein